MDEQNMLTIYDEKLQTRELQIMKTMVPYLSPKNQRQISFLIQFMQLKTAMSLIDGNEKNLQAAELTSATDKRAEMLSALKKFCSPKERETIDTIVNLLSVMDNCDNLFV